MRVGGSPGTRLIEDGFQRRGNAQDFIRGAWGHGEALLIFPGRGTGSQPEPFFRTQVIPELSLKQKSHRLGG